MFGLSLVFAPLVVKQLDLPETLVNQKALLTVAWDTIWFYLMMVMFAIDDPIYTQDLFLPGTFFVALGWAIFCDYRYLPGNGWMKTAGFIIVDWNLGNNWKCSRLGIHFYGYGRRWKENGNTACTWWLDSGSDHRACRTFLYHRADSSESAKKQAVEKSCIAI